MEFKEQPIILSGIQPSGVLTIGHLAGALKNWVDLQHTFRSFYMIANMHAITVKQVAADLRLRTLQTAALFLAAGVDPDKSILFIQSQVPEHAQLAWVLNTLTGFGELSRMTQFKDKSERNPDNINAGLFTYPVLMAADILLYQADAVPVGEDQKQHLELARNLAQRFNYHYSDTFKIPEPYIPKVGARIMSLQVPTSKMSKSDENQNACIFLNESDETIINKIKRAVTDSGNEVRFDEKLKPGVSNLMTLYHLATNLSFADIEKEFEGKGYGDFKLAVGKAVAEWVAPVREKYNTIMNDKKRLEEILKFGAEEAHKVAYRTLDKVYKKVGFIRF
ncbi:MAG: tryptophan--tRNA ligase [Candidatus Kapaibacteriota bacterium]